MNDPQSVPVLVKDLDEVDRDMLGRPRIAFVRESILAQLSDTERRAVEEMNHDADEKWKA